MIQGYLNLPHQASLSAPQPSVPWQAQTIELHMQHAATLTLPIIGTAGEALSHLEIAQQ